MTRHLVPVSIYLSLLLSCNSPKEYKSFDEYPSYDDLELFYSPTKSVFTLWAPTAEEVRLNLYASGEGGEPVRRLPMKSSDKGTWRISVSEDLKGSFYTFQIRIGDKWLDETPGIWAKAVGVNGNRAAVIDWAATDPEGWEADKSPELKSFSDIIIYEMHHRDFSIAANSGVTHKGKFLALAEEGTKGPGGVATGVDHLKELGVTHVHILPSYDYGSVDETRLQDNVYNWGYDPKNYNAPEGSYSTDPYNPEARIREFKEMVRGLHRNGIRVIMDVVYNHTFNVHDSCFYKTAGNYFYRMLDAAKYSDASACGNEIASEKPMVRKYIIDSLCYWASEYHIDGFRFDLMGVLDIETLNEARKALLKINPDIIMYGEGWTGGESTLPESERGMKINAPRTPGIGMFSDDIRDAVKGHVFYMDELGFVNGAADRGEELKQAVTCAKWAKSPMQSINYLSCHDNYTLWDRFIISNSHESEEIRIRMNKLAAAILFTAQGIPFFLHGEEFARTKISEADGAPVENSYCSPLSVNAIDYDRAEQFSDLKAYYKGLIALRRAHKSFYLDTVDEIKKSVHFMDDMPDGVVAYTIDNDTEKVFVAYNAGKNKITIKLADALWEVLADEASAGDKALYTIKDQAIIPGVSCLVAVCKC